MTDLLPANSTLAERAISLALDRFAAIPMPADAMWSPERIPVDNLPWLAWAVSIDDWDPAWTDAEKRAAIASSADWHRIKGTRAAVAMVLASLGHPGATVFEARDLPRYGRTHAYGRGWVYGPQDPAWADYWVAIPARLYRAEAARIALRLADTAPARCRLRAISATAPNRFAYGDGHWTYGADVSFGSTYIEIRTMVDLLTVQALPETGDWPETIPRLEDGWYPTGGPVDPANDQGIANWQARELAIRTRVLKERVDNLALKSGSLTTVGVGGDFQTLNAALAYLSERRQAYAPGGFLSEVRLLAGFQMAEQVLVSGANLGWITITAVAAEVVISRGALAQMMGSSYPAFGVSNGGALPRINALFVMDGTGVAANRVGIYAHETGSASVGTGGGVKGAGAHGIRAETAGQVSANGGIFTGAGEMGIYAAGGTRISAQSADLSNAGANCIFAANGAIVHAEAAICVGGNTRGILASRGATVNAVGANARRSGVSGADSPADFVVDQGGTIVATTGIGGLSVTANQLSAAGVIYR